MVHSDMKYHNCMSSYDLGLDMLKYKRDSSHFQASTLMSCGHLIKLELSSIKIGSATIVKFQPSGLHSLVSLA